MTMPDKIYAQNYESDMGHGEWDDYEPFANDFATRDYQLAHYNINQAINNCKHKEKE